MFNIFKALYDYRGFVVSSVRNEFVTRFARSKLGGLWMILQPLSQVAIYALILSSVLSAKLPGVDNTYAYAIYLTAGMLSWTLFSELITRCLGLFVNNANLMKKILFPKVTLLGIVVGTCLLENLMLFASIICVFALLGHTPTIAMFWLPLLLVVTLIFGLGLGLILGVLNVFMRDLQQVVPIILQLLFWFTPIVYPISIIPEAYRGLLVFNPLYFIVSAYQDILVYGRTPEFLHLSFIASLGVLFLAVGFFIFRRASEEMVDVL